jgi:putative acetyltransferase
MSTNMHSSSHSPALVIRPVQAPADLELVKTLFNEYVQWLGIDLSFQDYEQEISHLPGKYAEPFGCILLAEWEQQPAGCIAFWPIAPNTCEMKRLFVRPHFRGHKIASQLVQAGLDWAKNKSYGKMVLDTLRSMTPAMNLYQSFGFVETSAYYYNPQPDVVYFEKKL